MSIIPVVQDGNHKKGMIMKKNKVSIYYGMNKIGEPLTTKCSGA